MYGASPQLWGRQSADVLSSGEVKATGRTEDNAACASSASLPLGSRQTQWKQLGPLRVSEVTLALGAKDDGHARSLHQFKIV